MLIVQNTEFHYGFFIYVYNIIWSYSPSWYPLCPLVGLPPLYYTSVSFLKISFHAWVRKDILIWLSLAYFTEQAHPLSFHIIWLYSLLRLSDTPLWISAASPTNWHLGWICNLASVNNASVNMVAQMLLYAETLTRYIAKSIQQNAAESHDSSIFSLWDTSFLLFSVH